MIRYMKKWIAMSNEEPADCGEAIRFTNDCFQGDFHAGENPAKVIVRLLSELLDRRKNSDSDTADR